MPFYKRENEQLHTANTVAMPDVTLTADDRAQHTYPVNDWYWFDTLDAAIGFYATLDKQSTSADYTLNGVTYSVPLDVDAQNTVTAITVAKMAGVFTNTVVHFSNGVKMPINSDEWVPFAEWFAINRNAKFLL
jgi:hypothetical protein